MPVKLSYHNDRTDSYQTSPDPSDHEAREQYEEWVNEEMPGVVSPSGQEWGEIDIMDVTSCNYDGDTSHCGSATVYRDNFHGAFAANYAAFDFEDPDDGMWPFRVVDRVLLIRAWALIQGNLDMVRWASCMATGNSRLSDHIEGVLLSESLKIHFHPSQGDLWGDLGAWGHLVGAVTGAAVGATYGGVGGAIVGGIGGAIVGIPVPLNGFFMITTPAGFGKWRVTVDTCNKEWQAIRAVWEYDPGDTVHLGDADVYSDRQIRKYNRMCAVVHLSCTVLHELSHTAWRGGQELLGADCSVPGLMASFFKRGIFARYRYTDRSGCCTGLGSFNTDCVPTFSWHSCDDDSDTPDSGSGNSDTDTDTDTDTGAGSGDDLGDIPDNPKEAKFFSLETPEFQSPP